MVLSNSQSLPRLPTVTHTTQYLVRMEMGETLDSASSTVSIGGRNISNLRHADDIDIVEGNDTELAKLVQSLDVTPQIYVHNLHASYGPVLHTTVCKYCILYNL